MGKRAGASQPQTDGAASLSNSARCDTLRRIHLFFKYTFGVKAQIHTLRRLEELSSDKSQVSMKRKVSDVAASDRTETRVRSMAELIRSSGLLKLRSAR